MSRNLPPGGFLRVQRALARILKDFNPRGIGRSFQTLSLQLSTLGGVLHESLPTGPSVEANRRKAQQSMVGRAILSLEPHLMLADEPLFCGQSQYLFAFARVIVELRNIADRGNLLTSVAAGLDDGVVVEQQVALDVRDAYSDGDVL